jgi:phospholipid transport system substrate-binding protein
MSMATRIGSSGIALALALVAAQAQSPATQGTPAPGTPAASSAAPAEQRQHFIDAFYHSLLANYGAALSEFTADRLKIFPTTVDPAKPTATVRTEVKRDTGDRVSVNYYMRKTPQGWKAWDVVIDGISYVNSYRTDFSAQIEQQGIDAVIKRLEAGEKPGAIGKQTATKS